MKTKKINGYKFFTAMLALFAMASCTEDFTNRPPEDAISLDAYYSTNEQVESATNGLYSRTWFQLENKFFWAVTEVGSGNMYTNSSDVNALRTFSLTGTDPELKRGWSSLWANVAQANSIINFLAARVGPDVSDSVLQNTIGEAYFMRATAYFYLVRMWGPVPIIENNLNYQSTPKIPVNRTEDIYTLIERDYLMAAEKLNAKTRGSNYAENGRVSKGSAKAMLAKAYLYMKDYAKAKATAEEVINSGEFKLLGGSMLPGKNFGDLFKYAGNNNEESIFALQWKGDGNYGSANNCNTQFGIQTSAVSTSNVSYGGVFAPSQDVLTAFTAGDLRRKETIMLPGDSYPDVKVVQGGFLTVPSADEIGGQNAGAAIKKYCLGIKGDAAGPADQWGMMDNNTYIMRYAELLLIHAEATLGNAGSTSDAGALASFNAVRARAGLSNLASITFDDIFKERRKELCFEGDYWFDLGRISRSQATTIMAAQNRGNRITAEYFTPEPGDFLIPFPEDDLAKNPLLTQPPVPYNFN